MISRQYRFHGLGSLRAVYRHGKTVRGPFSSLKYLSNHKHQTYRAAVVVSRKVHKSAVIRNRIRRRIYEVLRHQEAELNKGCDMVWTVFSDRVNELGDPGLQKLVRSQLEQAHLLNSATKQPTPSGEGQNHGIVKKRNS